MKWITGLIGTAGVPMRSRANRVQPWTLRPKKMLICIPNRRPQQPILTTEIKLNAISVAS